METLTIVAWISLCAGGLSAIVVYVDISMGRYQPMPIMNLVWPITALYMGPIGIFAYWKYARVPLPERGASGSSHSGVGEMSSAGDMGEEMTWALYTCPMHPEIEQDEPGACPKCGMGLVPGGANMGMMDQGEKPITFKSIFISATHCGAGCAVADLLSETLIFVLGITLFGAAIWAGFVIDYFVALAFGIAFQYYNIMPMRPDLTPREGVWEAAKADVLSLTAFQVGMYSWMLGVYFMFEGTLMANSPVFWWMMQIAMGFGLITNFPVNYLLIRWGIKHPCA